MKSYVLKQAELLQEKTFRDSLCIAGIEFDRETGHLLTNQPFSIRRWLRVWIKKWRSKRSVQ